MDKYDPCSQCGLPIKPYKQTNQEREDICENCHIANMTQEVSSEEENLSD